VPSLPRPVLPAERRAVLPIGDPFIVQGLYVPGRVVGADSRALAESFVVDSGATVSVIRENLVAELRLPARDAEHVMTVDPMGRTRRMRLVTVPEVWLGPFLLRGLEAAVLGVDNLIGNDVLGQLAWEVDLDRATVTLDAPPWPAGAALARVPLVAAGLEATARDDTLVQSGPRIVVRLDGREVAMTLDTGASGSALPAALVKALGLRPPPGPREQPFIGTAHALRERAALASADLAIGDAHVGRRTFLVLEGGADNHGLLGMDVLGSYVFRVEPGRWLELRARGDLEATAEARIARWPWAPRCPPLGCATARLEGTGDATVVAMTLLATYLAEPTSFLWRSKGIASKLGVAVFLPSASAGQTVRLAPRGASPGWRALLPAACAELALVDVNPAGLAVKRLGPTAAIMGTFAP
jgi:predicted aspartyl protease